MRFPSGVTDQYLYFVAVDSSDLITRETGLSSFTVYRARNGAAAAAYTTPTIAEVSSANMPGVYSLLLDEDMTIGSGNDSEEIVLHITCAGMAPVTLKYELYRNVVTAGETLTVASGRGTADVTHIAGSAVSTTTAQLGVNVVNINASLTATQRLQQMYTAMASGTADSGTTTTMVDAGLSQSDDDYWTGGFILFTSGNIIGQCRRITDFNAATDTVTFAPALTQAVSTQTYIMIPASAVDIGAWNGAAVTGDGDWSELQTDVDATLADTNELQTDWVNGGRLDLILDARASQASVDDLPTNAELTTALGAADDAVLAQIALVKAQTDLIPSDPADASVIAGRFDTVDAAIAALPTADVSSDVTAIKAKTDSLAFTTAGHVDANILYVKNQQVTGDGSAEDPWGP